MSHTTRILAVILCTVIGMHAPAIAMAQSADPLSLIFTPPDTHLTSTTLASNPPTATTEETIPKAPPADLATVSNVVGVADATSITLTWDKVDTANNYTVYYGDKSAQDGSAYANAIVVGDVTTYTITDLTPGMTYYLAVTAENIQAKVGSKFYSSEINVTLAAAQTPTTTASEEKIESAPAAPATEAAPPEGMHGSAPAIKKLPQSGPEAALIILFSSMSAYLLRKRANKSFCVS